MRPLIGACLALLVLALQAGAAVSASAAEPSDRGCLLAWNAPSNHRNRVKLIAARPVTGLSLRAGESSSYSWTKGTRAKQTAAEACLLTVAKRGGIQVVTGRWGFGPVNRWSWSRLIPTTFPVIPNVRLLSDGRVAKIYSR
jgi:hypothetical protein